MVGDEVHVQRTEQEAKSSAQASFSNFPASIKDGQATSATLWPPSLRPGLAELMGPLWPLKHERLVLVGCGLWLWQGIRQRSGVNERHEGNVSQGIGKQA